MPPGAAIGIFADGSTSGWTVVNNDVPPGSNRDGTVRLEGARHRTS